MRYELSAVARSSLARPLLVCRPGLRLSLTSTRDACSDDCLLDCKASAD
jgi:hypothetical protein